MCVIYYIRFLFSSQSFRSDGSKDVIKSPMLSFKQDVKDDDSTTHSVITRVPDVDPEDRCRFTVNGVHSPIIILKDNDLKYKIRLPRATSSDLLNQLTKDADFLLSIGVMDYSLLVGVHNTDYEVSNEFPEPSSPISSSVPFSDYSPGGSNSNGSSSSNGSGVQRKKSIYVSSPKFTEIQPKNASRLQVTYVSLSI